MLDKNIKTKFLIYARKSTDSEDRQIRSIADQLAELRELAKKENINYGGQSSVIIRSENY